MVAGRSARPWLCTFARKCRKKFRLAARTPPVGCQPVWGIHCDRMDEGTRERLVADFEQWLTQQHHEGADAIGLGLMLAWKQSYGDGELYRWRTADVEEFLLDYCPRKVSARPDLAARVPGGVAAAMVFLGVRGLLRAGSDTAARLSECALKCADEYLASMSDPTLFGMAKRMVVASGALDPVFDINAPGVMDQLMTRATSAAVVSQRITVGPVVVPSDEQRRAGAAVAPALQRFQLLHEVCAAPGLKLTATGNLNRADARRLVELLDTGDVPDVAIGDRTYRLRSAADLRGLTRWVEWAVAAGVVRRYRGRLVAVASWLKAAKDPLTAFDRIVDALQRIGPIRLDWHWEFDVELAAFIESGTGRVLAELLDADGPIEIDAICDLVTRAVRAVFRVSPMLHGEIVARQTRDLLDRFAECGVVRVDGVITDVDDELPYLRLYRGGTVALTPPGVAVAIRLAKRFNIDVLERPDPATVTEAALIDLVAMADQHTWVADVRAWADARGLTGQDAAALLVAALVDRLAEHAVLGTIEALHVAFGAAALPAIRTLLGGPHDAVAVLWLSQLGELDHTSLDPPRLLSGAVAMLAALLDIDGVDTMIGALGGRGEFGGPHGIIGQLWRADHPRTGEVLTAVAAHHPDQQLAKAARKSALKFNSRSH